MSKAAFANTCTERLEVVEIQDANGCDEIGQELFGGLFVEYPDDCAANVQGFCEIWTNNFSSQTFQDCRETFEWLSECIVDNYCGDSHPGLGSLSLPNLCQDTTLQGLLGLSSETMVVESGQTTQQENKGWEGRNTLIVIGVAAAALFLDFVFEKCFDCHGYRGGDHDDENPRPTTSGNVDVKKTHQSTTSTELPLQPLSKSEIPSATENVTDKDAKISLEMLEQQQRGYEEYEIPLGGSDAHGTPAF